MKCEIRIYWKPSAGNLYEGTMTFTDDRGKVETIARIKADLKGKEVIDVANEILSYCYKVGNGVAAQKLTNIVGATVIHQRTLDN